jgi:hypothetical protein
MMVVWEREEGKPAGCPQLAGQEGPHCGTEQGRLCVEQGSRDGQWT